MMNSALITLLSVSISGSVLAAVLFALKPLLTNRVSKAFSYYIWLIVLLRLILPVAIPVNAMDTLFFAEKPAVQTEQPVSDTANALPITPNGDVQPSEAETQTQNNGSAISPSTTSPKHGLNFWNIVLSKLHLAWAVGAFISFAWFVASYICLVCTLKRTSVLPLSEYEAVFASFAPNKRVRFAVNGNIRTPMLVGVFRPIIHVPQLAYAQNGTYGTIENILRHELTHYKRKDLIFKWFVVIVTSLHWFNPLMILVRREISRAGELSCDEAVIKDMSDNERQTYGEMLIALSAHKRLTAGMPVTSLSDGKSELKERLVSIMNYKKKNNMDGTYVHTPCSYPHRLRHGTWRSNGKTRNKEACHVLW